MEHYVKILPEVSTGVTLTTKLASSIISSKEPPWSWAPTNIINYFFKGAPWSRAPTNDEEERKEENEKEDEELYSSSGGLTSSIKVNRKLFLDDDE